MYRRTSKVQEKPTVIADYNQHMLGVDKLDQLVSYYSFVHRSVKWWRKVFFWLLEVSVVNSYIIYKEECMKQGINPKTHLGHRRALIDSLSEVIRTSVRVPHRLSASNSLERLQPIKHFMTKGTKRKDCVVCSSRKPGGTRHLTLFTCTTCSQNPSLCPGDCFKVYHTKKNIHI